MTDIIIAGAGTAGLSAAIYGARAGKSVLLLEGNLYGGQIITSPDIANYPGIKQTTGFDFATNLYEQAMDLGAEIEFVKINGITIVDNAPVIHTAEKDYFCRTFIIASGAVNRPLGLVGEESLVGKGIAYCATCDGVFFKDKDIAVSGGGNTALEDAIFLSEYCKKVTIIHRRDSFKGENHMLENLKKKDNVFFEMTSSVTKLNYHERLESITVQNNDTKAVKDLAVDGLFIAVGQVPQNAPFSPPLSLDERGYIVAGEDCTTNIPSVFAAGDCRTKKVRQLATAAADGAVAALACCEYMEKEN